jgi:hypothetical protein
MPPEVLGQIIALKITTAALIDIIRRHIPGEAEGIAQTLAMCLSSVQSYRLPGLKPDDAELIRAHAEFTIETMFTVPVHDAQ